MKVKQTKYMRLSGLEPLILNENSNFTNIGERTNVAGSSTPLHAELISGSPASFFDSKSTFSKKPRWWSKFGLFEAPVSGQQKSNKTILAGAKQLFRSLGVYSTNEKQLLAAATSVFSFLGIEIHTPMECRWWSNLGLFGAPGSVPQKIQKRYKTNHVEAFCCSKFDQNPKPQLGHHRPSIDVTIFIQNIRKRSWLQPGALS